MSGRRVEIPQRVERVAGLGPGALRLLAYLGCSSRVAGVEDIEKRDFHNPYLFAHPELRRKPSLGPPHGGNPELVAAARPDVVFWTYVQAGDAAELQAKIGAPVIVLRYGDLDDQRKVFFRALRLMARVMDRKERAESLIDTMLDLTRDLKQRTSDVSLRKRPTCYAAGIGYRGMHGIGSTEPDYVPFEMVSARNVAGSIDQEHVILDPEQVLEWNPEYMFIDQGGAHLVLNNLRSNPAFSSLQAVRSGRIYSLLPYNFYTTNYATVFANAYFIGKVLYPDRFRDVDPQAKADEIYEHFLGQPVYRQMADAFGGFGRLRHPDEL
jgi:iron complex transport system substrate-binding protein